MSLFTTSSILTVTCNSRLAPYLEMEIKDLGYEVLDTFITGLTLRGTLNDCIHLNLNLRCASQVLYSLIKFDAINADDVYEVTKSLPWEEILGNEQYFSVTSNVQNETINNNLFANLRVKDAIVDRYREKGMERPASGAELKGTVISLFWKGETAELFLNTSGDSLGRHGYRKIPGTAPMLEALAAATLQATKWTPEAILVNPMCGSGTIAIEAALMASKTAPGLFRTNFAFMHIQGFNEAYYLQMRGDCENKIIDKPTTKIIASDIREQAVLNARKNAQAAGVEDWIHFQICDFADTEIPEEDEGIIFLNPEYGLRLGEIRDLENTYARIGDFFKQKCSGYTGYVFTGNMDLAKKIGLKAKRRIEFYNSKLDCRLLEYELYKGKKPESYLPTTDEI